MTILSNNLKKLREHRKLPKEFIARYCGVTPAAVAQWELETGKSYVPKIDKLMTLAGLYKTTVDEMYNNKNLIPGEIVNPMLDNKILEKVFRTLDKSETLSYAYAQANIKRRAYLFTLLYSLCEEITSNYLDETEVTALMGIENEPKKAKTTTGTRKRSASRTKPTTNKKH